MTISSVIQKPWQCVKSLPMKQKLWALALVVIVVCFLIPRGGGATQGDAKKRIELANKAQGKLCLMKIDAATCAYVSDDPIYKVSYKACYEHNGEADVVIDLTKADVLCSKDGEIKVVVPNPAIDKSTLNLRAGRLILVKKFGGRFRSEDAKTKCDAIAEEMVREDFCKTINDNFPLSDARQQAISVLHAMYGALGADNITVEFQNN